METLLWMNPLKASDQFFIAKLHWMVISEKQSVNTRCLGPLESEILNPNDILSIKSVGKSAIAMYNYNTHNVKVSTWDSQGCAESVLRR